MIDFMIAVDESRSTWLLLARYLELLLVVEESYLFLIWVDKVLFDLYKSLADVLDVRFCLTLEILLE